MKQAIDRNRTKQKEMNSYWFIHKWIQAKALKDYNGCDGTDFSCVFFQPNSSRPASLLASLEEKNK